MILLDTETTGAPEPMLVPLDQQPRIIELGALKVDNKSLKVLDSIHFLCNPGMSIPAEITKVTGITDEMVSKEKKFVTYVAKLSQFFLGEDTLVAHNEAFDHRMLELELERLGRLTQFPWPINRICTVERTQARTGKFLKLSELYQKLFGKDPDQKHRALGDVEILHEVCIKLRAEKIL